MPSFAPGAVVVVPFPYTDRLAEKRRPALVVSEPALEVTGFIWVVMITTAKRTFYDHDVAIGDPAAAGLAVPCLIRPSKIACIEPTRVLRQAGRLDDRTAARVFEAARAFIARPRPESDRP